MASVSIWTGTAPYLKATINWGNGSAVDIQQNPIVVVINGSNYTFYLPAFQINPSLSAPQDGFITNITEPNTTFNGTNQNLNVKYLALGGITSFDTDLTNLNSLINLTLGGYYSTINQTQTTPTIGSLNNDAISIASFTTILPNTSSNHSVSFLNNLIDCVTFTPTWNSKSTSFYFKNNQQVTPLVISSAQRFSTVEIQNNSKLTSVTLNGMQFLNGNCRLDNNALTSVSINGLNTNTTSGTLDIYLNNNQFTTFSPSWISSFPPTKEVNINLSLNKFVSFDCLFNGPNMGTLNLSSQLPVPDTLIQITDDTTSNSTFKIFNLSTNKLQRCPIFPTTTIEVRLDNTEVVATGISQGGLITPNLSPNITTFSLNGSVNLANLSEWTPNSTQIITSNKHTPLQNITTWISFSITSQGLTSWTHQFSPNISSPLSSIDLQRNHIDTIDMSLIGGFANVILRFQKSGNGLALINNLTSVTKTRTLDVSVNYTLTSSLSIIKANESWPPTLYKLDFYRCTGLVSWTKSFAGFNSSGLGNFDVNFNSTNLNATSINFIITDLIKSTTLTNGNLFFSSNVGGTTYNFPKLLLSQFGPDTQACLTCLTTPTNTPCTPTLSSGSNLTGMGRGFTVTLLTA